MTKEEKIDELWENSNHGARKEDIETAYNAGVSAEQEHCVKLAAWLQWCLDNCDDSPEWNFGTKATGQMRALLAGEDAPMPNRN